MRPNTHSEAGNVQCWNYVRTHHVGYESTLEHSEQRPRSEKRRSTRDLGLAYRNDAPDNHLGRDPNFHAYKFGNKLRGDLHEEERDD
jgi:hypothetical protein